MNAKQCARDVPGFIYRVVLCELAWVMATTYVNSKDTIMSVLEKLLRTSQLKIEDVPARVDRRARMYQKGKAAFAVCLLGPTNRIGGCEWTVTFDQPASKLEGFQLL